MNSRSLEKFLKAVGVAMGIIFTLWAVSRSYENSVAPTVSQYGSRGNEVIAIQEKLKERGLFNDDVTGYYGPVTQAAVKRFQKQQGISQTGIAGPQTLKALGIREKITRILFFGSSS